MPDLESWALASYAETDGEVVGVTTSALWDLVQSTVADCYVPANAGEGGLYVVGSVNAPRGRRAGGDSTLFRVRRRRDGRRASSRRRLRLRVRRSRRVILRPWTCRRRTTTRDVVSPPRERRRRRRRRGVSAAASRRRASEVDTNEAACEALRVRVRRSRAIVRAAIAKCTRELFKTRRFDRFFDRSEQAGRLARLALDRKIGDPHKFIKDLRSCAKALKPRRNTHSNFHKPTASLGFSAVDTLESWFHLGVSKLYAEYAARDAEYDGSLSRERRGHRLRARRASSPSTPIVEDVQEIERTPEPVPASPRPRLPFEDVFGRRARRSRARRRCLRSLARRHPSRDTRRANPIRRRRTRSRARGRRSMTRRARGLDRRPKFMRANDSLYSYLDAPPHSATRARRHGRRRGAMACASPTPADASSAVVEVTEVDRAVLELKRTNPRSNRARAALARTSRETSPPRARTYHRFRSSPSVICAPSARGRRWWSDCMITSSSSAARCWSSTPR